MPSVIFDLKIGPYQVLPFQARVNQGVMAMKENSTIPKSPGLKLRHQMFKCQFEGTRCGSGGVNPLQRFSSSILQPQPTGM